jgi:hypothetical protein
MVRGAICANGTAFISLLQKKIEETSNLHKLYNKMKELAHFVQVPNFQIMSCGSCLFAWYHNIHYFKNSYFICNNHKHRVFCEFCLKVQPTFLTPLIFLTLCTHWISLSFNRSHMFSSLHTQKWSQLNSFPLSNGSKYKKEHNEKILFSIYFKI